MEATVEESVAVVEDLVESLKDPNPLPDPRQVLDVFARRLLPSSSKWSNCCRCAAPNTSWYQRRLASRWERGILR